MQKKNIKTGLIITIVYVLFGCAFMISHRIWFSPDQFFLFAIIGVLLLGRLKQFLSDWTPFLSLFLGYEYLRGFVPLIDKNVHIFQMINIDKAIFGLVPTIKLQSLLYNPLRLQWYDYVAVTLYICHFIAPMITGFLFWLKDREFFRKFTAGLLVLSYAAFLTFLVFPAMPPWMASSQGFLPPVKEVTGVVMSHFFKSPFTLPSIYSFFRPNPVAAMPSLHAAFPMLIFLFALKKSWKIGIFLIPYVLGVWFAVIYLGEHYFIDVVMGALYATLAFVLVEKKETLLKLLKKKEGSLQAHNLAVPN